MKSTIPAWRAGATAWLLAISCATALLGLAACNNERPPAQPARFNQPNRADFACFDAATTQVLPRSECAGASTANKLALNAIVTQAGRGEVAVVDLRARRVLDSRRDIPGYTFVPVGESPRAIVIPPEHPQHTYVADYGSRDVRVLRTRALVATVTDSPDAQTVSLRAEDVDGLLAPTDMVLAPDESALFVTIPDAGLAGGLVLRLPILRCSADSDADCEDGLIDENAITSVRVSETTVPAPIAPVTPSSYEQLCGFERAQLPAPTPITLDSDALEILARPSALTFDAFCRDGESCVPHLLVADAAQPVIHVLDIDAWAAGSSDPKLPPLVTGVPTSAVVVTPHVPRTADGEGETQYVYAIDAQDGSVLVLEHGQVLNVNSNPGQRSDRLTFSVGSAGATALEVMTPAFDVHGPAAQYVGPSTTEPSTPEPAVVDDPLQLRTFEDQACTDEDHDEQDPARLRGVFLAAAMTDGTVHVVDVHDMELRANDGSANSCGQCAREKPSAQMEDGGLPPLRNIPLLARNQERLLTSFVAEEGDELPTFEPALTSFAFYVDASSFTVRADGSSASSRAPGLDCIACDPALTSVFPGAVDESTSTTTTGSGAAEPIAAAGCTSDAPSLLCVANDPWSAGAEGWSASYEGSLPASVGHGRFILPDGDGNQTGGLELVAATDFCNAGVLGEEDMGPDYGDCAQPDNLVGDQLVVGSRPLGRERLSQLKRGDNDQLDACAELRAELEADPQLHVAFEIRRAYSDRLVLQSTLLRPIGKAKTFADVAVCYEDAVNFDVRSSQAFTVIGAQTGFQHHVRANGAKRCQVDLEGDPLLHGRARLGCSFRNHSLQFQLRAPGDNDLGPIDRLGVGLQIGFANRAAKLVFHAYDLGFGTATVVPVQLRYSDVDRKLYLLDSNDRGLVPISVAPFPSALTSSGQYN